MQYECTHYHKDLTFHNIFDRMSMRIKRRWHMPHYMMATTAIHQLGDISREKLDLCIIEGEEGENYIGQWVEGYGFINVKFPKATTRELTGEEKDYIIQSLKNAKLR